MRIRYTNTTLCYKGEINKVNYELEEIRSMGNKQIMAHMRDIIQGNNKDDPVAHQDMAKMYIVMAQRKGIDPRSTLRSHGMLEYAEKSGWL